MTNKVWIPQKGTMMKLLNTALWLDQVADHYDGVKRFHRGAESRKHAQVIRGIIATNQGKEDGTTTNT